jgi:hypothetical protein
VETTFAGAGVISGDLTPECAAVVTAVLDALSAPIGAQDTRTREQRYHDALEDAMRRLAAGGLLPKRAGQSVKVWAHVSLAELRALDDGSVLQEGWIGEMAARWAARRAAACQTGGDGAAWLDGRSAGAVACDATLIPVVTGQIDPAALDDLVDLCLQFTGHGPRCGPARRGLRGAPRHPPGRRGHHQRGRLRPVLLSSTTRWPSTSGAGPLPSTPTAPPPPAAPTAPRSCTATGPTPRPPAPGNIRSRKVPE